MCKCTITGFVHRIKAFFNSWVTCLMHDPAYKCSNGEPCIAQWLTGKFVRCQVRANETYSEAKRQFSVRNRDVLMNVQSPHKWWTALKSCVRLEFVIVSACWWVWWAGVRVGFQGCSADRSF